MKISEDRKRKLLSKIRKWLDEKPDCLWMKQAVYQLQQYEEISTR